MPLDGLLLSKLIEEINPIVSNSLIRGVYDIDENSFFLELFNEKSLTLVINLHLNNNFIFLNKIKFTKIKKHFHYLFKKTLIGKQITGVVQHQMDRIVIVSLKDIETNEISYIILELFSRYNNVLVLNSSYEILTIEKEIKTETRSFIVGDKYEFPQTFLFTQISNEKTFPNYIANSIKQILIKNDIAEDDLKYKPSLSDNYDYYFADLFPNSQSFNDLSMLLQTVFSDLFINKTPYLINKVINLIKKFEVNLQDNYQKINEYKESIDSKRSILNDIETNYVLYYQSLAKDILPDYKSNDTLRVADYREHLYIKIKKDKQSISQLEDFQNQDLKNKIDDLNSLLVKLNQNNFSINDNLDKLVQYKIIENTVSGKVKSTKIQCLSFTIGNNKVYIGKNQEQNKYIYKTFAKPNDIFIHIANSEGPHLLIKNSTRELPSLNIIRNACMLNLFYSSMKDLNNVPFYYTFIKFTKQAKKVPKFKVVLTQEKTLFINIDAEILNLILDTRELIY